MLPLLAPHTPGSMLLKDPSYLSPNGNGTTPAPPHRIISASCQCRTLLAVRRTTALGETVVVLAVSTAAAGRAGVLPIPHAPKHARGLVLLGKAGLAGGGSDVGRVALLTHQTVELGGRGRLHQA